MFSVRYYPIIIRKNYVHRFQGFKVSHRKGPGSTPGVSMYVLRWRKWQWHRFFSEYFGFLLSALFQQRYIILYILTFKNRASHIQDGHTATLQMLHFIFFLTNISTEYFKHAAHSLFFSSKCRLFHNATFLGSCIIHILYTGCAKI